ncbi:MAG: hypothetical protein R2856_38790 [Caldilineaceae bacterium]
MSTVMVWTLLPRLKTWFCTAIVVDGGDAVHRQTWKMSPLRCGSIDPGVEVTLAAPSINYFTSIVVNLQWTAAATDRRRNQESRLGTSPAGSGLAGPSSGGNRRHVRRWRLLPSQASALVQPV